MPTETRKLISLQLALVLCGFLPERSAHALCGELATKINSVVRVVRRSVPEANCPDGPNKAACDSAMTSCRRFLTARQTELPDSLKEHAVTDVRLTCNTEPTVAAAGEPGGDQLVSFSRMNNILGLSSGTEAEIQANASATGRIFRACQEDYRSNCPSAPLTGTNVRNYVRDVSEACGEGTTASNRVAGTAARDGMNLGDMAKTMGAAAQLMGAGAQLAQLANRSSGSGGSDTSGLPTGGEAGATSPTGSSMSGLGNQKESTSLGDASGRAVGSPISLAVNPNGSKVGASQSGPGSGSGGYNSSNMSDGVLGSGTGSSSSAAKAGADMSKASGGGAGAGGGKSSSGASALGSGGRLLASDGSGSADKADAYEIKSGGGITNRAGMMGLKPGGGDLADALGGALNPGDAAAPGGLNDLSLGATEAGGSAGGARAGTEASSAGSMFQTIHAKYVELVKKGRF